MTLVHFAPVGNGTTTPKGYIEGRMIGAEPLADSFRAVLVDGEVTHEVEPTTVAQAWNFIERVDYGRDEYVQVDDDDATVEYDDLTTVNGDDFSPSVAPSAGWQAALTAEATARATADALLQPVATLSDAIEARVGAAYAGPTLPAYDTGTHYVWTKTDAVTGDLIDIITGVAP